MDSGIEIVDYSPEWADVFALEKERLSGLAGLDAVVIEHVGSTAIPGQQAKPVVDMFVGVKPFRPAAYYKDLLDPACYTYVQTGMRGRHLFAKSTEGVWTHNVHLMPYDEQFHTRNEMLLRDYLRRHPELVEEYGAIKWQAARSAESMNAYTRAKTAFIQSVVDAARAEKGLPLEDVWEE
ncbi:GrpB-like predicted nucleotidyltransferase (UPF0157 family) [Paenibacillus rhizosphaerae]|uniref:GrpB-like predicted nucleotidyltransferase (UPF0157 family) n=1 Tax=Paenibacillus rhizosphaerae TaxID=297318 RepID=A0A839TI31_9BACL|nr:GrpB family protein [Paenibacillus rhizosphaerae]MBB3126331.1 GrpB-like predicted nucleotidyltransferase (UPF0157 family) [Paenibacillus rhizosphaerae]